MKKANFIATSRTKKNLKNQKKTSTDNVRLTQVHDEDNLPYKKINREDSKANGSNSREKQRATS